MPDESSATVDGAKLRSLRLAKGLSQEELAADSDIKQSTISKIENGSAVNPRYETAVKLARALGARPQDLLAVAPDDLDVFDPEVHVMLKELGREPTEEETESIKGFLRHALERKRRREAGED